MKAQKPEMTFEEAKKLMDQAPLQFIPNPMTWTKDKPVFAENCVLVTASRIPKEGYHYTLFEIRKTDDMEGRWYWGIFEDGQEWGDLADLTADLYCILPKH